MVPVPPHLILFGLGLSSASSQLSSLASGSGVPLLSGAAHFAVDDLLLLIVHAVLCRSWMAFVSFRKVRGLIVFFPFLKFHDCAPGNSGLAREQLGRKLLRFCPDLIQIFRSTTLSYSRQVSSAGSSAPASANMDRSGRPPSA